MSTSINTYGNEDAEKNESRNLHTTATDDGAVMTTTSNSSPEAKYSACTEWEKRLIVIGAAVGAIFSPLTVQIYLPSV